MTLAQISRTTLRRMKDRVIAEIGGADQHGIIHCRRCTDLQKKIAAAEAELDERGVRGRHGPPGGHAAGPVRGRPAAVPRRPGPAGPPPEATAGLPGALAVPSDA